MRQKEGRNHGSKDGITTGWGGTLILKNILFAVACFAVSTYLQDVVTNSDTTFANQEDRQQRQ